MSKQSPGYGLRWLPYLFASGAVFWLVELTRLAAYLAAPAGRQYIRDMIIDAGIKTNVDAVFVGEVVAAVLVAVIAISLHGAAYYGLRSFRGWGWVVAVVVSVAWSVVLVGIPVLVFLLRRPVRQAYGIS